MRYYLVLYDDTLWWFIFLGQMKTYDTYLPDLMVYFFGEYIYIYIYYIYIWLVVMVYVWYILAWPTPGKQRGRVWRPPWPGRIRPRRRRSLFELGIAGGSTRPLANEVAREAQWNSMDFIGIIIDFIGLSWGIIIDFIGIHGLIFQ